mmetsp:Transcript_14432/g.42424  ORF Transcript_14432/g.42424 Transcript_14432/m.42424 type:complete len:145 (-) Transcript_14432:208-642(-)|eukprot:CAMPEP_0206041800 /NCGR_PEP_ID=MMETSP1466-20131121/6177_1 /ASSEMBLY_ACC=CAM_ASM_001126 /TAXON_ID=44452 /ORGANISM="Pavlova gyrans, Strain CCMP608" /LENGTH=144 /DNA_ID=CAMNT_0053416503 /DNA_START=74 /DNA_END=508 /DNA_ORIENTATION=+
MASNWCTWNINCFGSKDDKAATMIGKHARGRLARQRVDARKVLKTEVNYGIKKASRTYPGIYQGKSLFISGDDESLNYHKPGTKFSNAKVLMFSEVTAITNRGSLVNVQMRSGQVYTFKTRSPDGAVRVRNALATFLDPSVATK